MLHVYSHFTLYCPPCPDILMVVQLRVSAFNLKQFMLHVYYKDILFLLSSMLKYSRTQI